MTTTTQNGLTNIFAIRNIFSSYLTFLRRTNNSTFMDWNWLHFKLTLAGKWSEVKIGIESVWWFSVYIWGGSNSVISEEERRLLIFMIWGNVSNEEELPIVMEILSVEWVRSPGSREREKCISVWRLVLASLIGQDVGKVNVFDWLDNYLG